MNETIYTTIDHTSIDHDVHAIDYGAIIYSHTGKASVRINFDHWQLQERDVLIFFPGDVVKWEQVSDNFSAEAIRYSSDILRSASLNIEHAIYEQLKADRRCDYRELIDEVVNSMFRIFAFYFRVEHYQMTDSIVTLHLQAFFLGFYDYLQSNIRSKSMGKSTQRTEELFTRFMQLLEDEYHKGHEVNYYADRMNITRKYLGIIVKNKTGLTPKQIIDEYIILHLKLKMRTSRNSLKQIADEYHFSDQSALTRYFRTHVGISPQQYRLK
ncbi:helix-turn-helix domain-containing protein [Segatella bryantii]|uniref:helix-turn-helix domain-containing protein n=1 Tax=Segatella bryantii TaxID=77095 RepID=UPI00242DF269|nr:helix-turn-helix domain-containing protein [Segatella bryantii]